VSVIMFHWKQRLHFPQNIWCQLTDSYDLKNTECCVNVLLLFYQILYAIKLILKSCIIRYLFQFMLTSLPGILSDCETVLLLFFDIIPEVKKVKTSLRKSSVSKRMEKKTGCFV
jgi:hypothetical protein